MAIYLACTVIDTISRKAIEEPLFKVRIFDKYFEKIDKFMDFETKEEIKLLYGKREK